MNLKEDIIALAWEYFHGSGNNYEFTEDALLEFVNVLGKQLDLVSLSKHPSASSTAQDEREIAELIDQRDNAEDWANKLSDAIASHTGAYIGEHSNMNCPWANALEAIENTRHAQTAPQPGQSGLPDVCDGKEQEAFEDFARGERMDMATHPLHWLFLNEKPMPLVKGGRLRSVTAALPYPPKED